MVKTLQIGERRVDNLSELSSDSFAWTTKIFNENIRLKQSQIVNENKVFLSLEIKLQEKNCFK